MAQATSKTTDDDLQTDYKQLRDDLAALREDVSSLAGHMKQAANGATADAKRKLANGGAKTAEAVSDAATTAKHAGQASLVAVEQRIQAHPLASLAIAFGVGLVAAQFMRRDK